MEPVYHMSEVGYDRRLASIEWHCKLWYSLGASYADCEAARRFLSASLDADQGAGEEGITRPGTAISWLLDMRDYFDREFASESLMPSGQPNTYISAREYYA